MRKLITLCTIISALAITGCDNSNTSSIENQKPAQIKVLSQNEIQRIPKINDALTQVNQLNTALDTRVSRMNGHPVNYDDNGRVSRMNGYPVNYDDNGRVSRMNGHPVNY